VRRAPSELGEISRHGGAGNTHHGLAFLNRSKHRDSSVHSPNRTRHGGGGTEDNVAAGTLLLAYYLVLIAVQAACQLRALQLHTV
jgi:hypothetical protein